MNYSLPLTSYNLRSFGGLTTVDQQKIREGMLFRSGTLDELVKPYVPLIESLQLKTIIDLRPAAEQSKAPRQFQGCKRITIPFDIDNLTRERLKPYIKKKNSENDIVKVIESVYRDMAEIFKPALRPLFDILCSEKSYPVLINCRAGKDRTGFVAALLLWVLGVPEESIIADYLKTNEWTLEIKRRRLWLIWLVTFGRYPAKNLEAAFMVRECYIRTALQTISNEYNGIENYLTDSGVTQSQVERFKQLLIGPSGLAF